MIISELQQRSQWTFLKYRAPCAAAHFPAANGRSPPRGPPTAASPASWGAATLPSAPAWSHVVLPTDAIRNHIGQVLGHRSDRATTRCDQINRLPLVVVRRRPTLTSFHPTPPGSSSLLQVSISSEEVHFRGRESSRSGSGGSRGRGSVMGSLPGLSWTFARCLIARPIRPTTTSTAPASISQCGNSNHPIAGLTVFGSTWIR